MRLRVINTDGGEVDAFSIDGGPVIQQKSRKLGIRRNYISLDVQTTKPRSC